MSQNKSQLVFNVGYLLHEARGCSRRYEFSIETIQFSEDLTLHDLEGSLELTKSADGLLAQGLFQAVSELDCTRCLEVFQQPLQIDFAELLVYPAKDTEDPVLGIPESALLDLRPLLRESFIVSFPMQPLCKPECRGLCPICGNNLNDSVCDHNSETIDPRMEVLKQLLD